MSSSDKDVLKTHKNINQSLCSEIQKLEDGYAESRLVTTNEMVADSKGLIHGGFVFGAADYTAMAAVNEENVVLTACSCKFTAPVKLGDIVNFTAKVQSRDGRKNSVYVTAYVLDVKVFEGEFKTFVTDKHVLELNLDKKK